MLKQALLLIAGFPGTGKTYLADQIMKQFPECVMVSLDPMKERLYDEFGFDDAVAKAQLDAMAQSDYLDVVDHQLYEGKSIVSDYPFSAKQYDRFHLACERVEAQPLTLRMTCDSDVLFERQRKRDLDPTRHLGHVVFQYHRGDYLQDRSKAEDLLTRSEFEHRLKVRGYDTFSLGPTLELDTTDFALVDYQAAMAWIARHLHDTVSPMTTSSRPH